MIMRHLSRLKCRGAKSGQASPVLHHQAARQYELVECIRRPVGPFHNVSLQLFQMHDRLRFYGKRDGRATDK